MRTTNIRFTGLASGLDTESLVSAMVMPYKMKVDVATQEQKLLELKKDAWKEMNTQIYGFYTDTLSKLRLESTFDQKKVTVSQPDVIEIEGNGNFPDGTHKIEVSQLAEGATLTTSKLEKDLKGNSVTEQTKLVEELGIEEGTELTLAGKTLQVTAETTIADLEKKLQEGGVSANFDSKAGAFFISSKETGANQEIKITSDRPGALKKLGFADSDEMTEVTATGKDAKITYNGLEVTSESNTVAVNGMNVKLKSTSDSPITVVSQTDTDAMLETVTGFVDKYNKLIADMAIKIDAPYNSDYMPLTEEEKKAMSEDDIKLWNEKVESSLLRKDPTLEALTSGMREILSSAEYTDESGKTHTLATFGITTSSDWKEGGKLYIDEDKFKKAMSDNPDALKQLFTHKADKADFGGDEKAAMKASGIGTRLYDHISDKLKSSSTNSANFLFNDKLLDQSIKDKEDEVSELEERMARMEDLYYSQFTAMEKAISEMNSQSSWLTSQSGGM